jgi:hypothetical protein
MTLVTGCHQFTDDADGLAPVPRLAVGVRSGLQGLPAGQLGFISQGALDLSLSLEALDDEGQGEGHDADEEHQGADAESPAGTVVCHDKDLTDPDVRAITSIRIINLIPAQWDISGPRRRWAR